MFTRGLSRAVLTKMFKTIGTHNGTFHCDEALGCFMLKTLSPDATIVRTRDLSRLQTCDIVIDVGGLYDPSKNRFDHHQAEFGETMATVLGKKWTTRLSSAGLVYCHYGKEVLKTILKEENDEILEAIFNQMYSSFIEEIDGIDNGVEMYDGPARYKISTHLSSRVGALNRNWNEEDFNEEEGFQKAMDLVGGEFTEKVRRLRNVWWPARDLVRKAILGRFDVHPSGEIMELENFCPWSDHFFELEKDLGVQVPIKYLIFPDSTRGFRVRSVPISHDSFILRKPLPAPWRGLSDTACSTASNIDGCIFVHHSGFIGGNKSREGALQMAITSLLA